MCEDVLVVVRYRPNKLRIHWEFYDVFWDSLKRHLVENKLTIIDHPCVGLTIVECRLQAFQLHFVKPLNNSFLKCLLNLEMVRANTLSIVLLAFTYKRFKAGCHI